MRVQFVDSGPGAGTYVDHVKLVRTSEHARFTGRIHEQILGSLRGKLGRIGGVILHSGYDKSPAGQLAKWRRDRRLLWLDLISDPHNPFYNFNLGMTNMYHGRLRSAKGWLRRALKYCRPQETILRKIYALLGITETQLGHPERALAILQEGLSRVEEDPELRFRIGSLLLEAGRPGEALEQLAAIQPNTDQFFASIDLGILSFTRFSLMAEAYLKLGDPGKAKEWFAKSLEANGRFKPAIDRLFDAYCETFDIGGARGALEHLLKVGGPTEEWTMKQLHLASLLDVPQMEALDRLVRAHPQAIAPKLILARSLLQSGQELAARPLLAELTARGNAESAFNLGVIAVKFGDLEGALGATRRAVKLDPANAVYRGQVESLEARQEQSGLSTIVGARDLAAIKGPYVGSLGKGRVPLSTVVVTHNSADTVRACIESVLGQSSLDDEVIVVDNASLDQTTLVVGKIAARDARVRLIQNRENVGYSRAANQGLLASSGKLLLLLNPDATLGRGCVDRLLRPLHGKIGATGPVSDNVGGLQFVGFHLNGAKPKAGELAATLAREHADQLLDAKALMGFCLALRRDVLDEHGLLCEETELGADDLELSWRFRELGYELKVVLDAFAHHEGSHSFTHTPEREMAQVRIRQSDRALVRRLVGFYGFSSVPSSRELWGSDIFCEAFGRSGLHLGTSLVGQSAGV